MPKPRAIYFCYCLASFPGICKLLAFVAKVMYDECFQAFLSLPSGVLTFRGLYHKTSRITEKEKIYGSIFSVKSYGKTIIIYRKKCLWYSIPKIFSFSVKKESVKFLSTDPRSGFISALTTASLPGRPRSSASFRGRPSTPSRSLETRATRQGSRSPWIPIVSYLSPLASHLQPML